MPFKKRTWLNCARNTNVYEERSLGIYAQDESLNEDERTTGILRSLVKHILRRTDMPPHINESSRSYFVRQQKSDLN